MDAALLEGDSLVRLKAAAEEIAFLTGRGYPPAEVKQLVSTHRGLTPDQRALLERAVCSETQYKARACREMLPEDIARRPLTIDAHDVIDVVVAALAGGALLEGIDQTVQLLSPLPKMPDREAMRSALERIAPVLREMRPSKTKWLLDESRADATALKEELLAGAKKRKIAIDVEIMPDPKATLRRAVNVATNDPAIIDACKSWCNLAGPVVAQLPGVTRVKLQ